MEIVDSLVSGKGKDQDEPELSTDENALGMRWMGRIPAHWRVEKAKQIFTEVVDKGHSGEELLSVTQDQGVVADRPSTSMSSCQAVTHQAISLFSLVILLSV